MLNTSHSIIFISGGIGDQLLHFNQIRAIARKSRIGKVDVACLNIDIMKKIALRCDWVNEIIDLSPSRNLINIVRYFKFLLYIKRKKYTHAYIFHPSTSFKFTAYLSRISNRIGFIGSFLDKYLVSEKIEEKSCSKINVWGHRPYVKNIEDFLSNNNFQLQNKSSTILSDKNNQKKIYNLFKQFPKPWFVINLYAKDDARRWPLNHAANVIYNCSKKFKGSYFLNSARDSVEYHRNLISKLKSKNKNIILTNDYFEDILMDIDLYSMADFYLGVNSFSAHLAFNCNLFSFVLYGKKEDILSYRGKTISFFPKSGKYLKHIKEKNIIDKIETKLNSLS